MIPNARSNIIVNYFVSQRIINIPFPILINPTLSESHLRFFGDPISAHPIFQFFLNLIPSVQHFRLNPISSDWNYFQITMTATRTNSKRGGTNVIIDEVSVGGSSLTLHYGLSITTSSHRTGQIWLSEMMQETGKELKTFTLDMGNEKFNGTLDRKSPVCHYQQEKSTRMN